LHRGVPRPSLDTLHFSEASPKLIGALQGCANLLLSGLCWGLFTGRCPDIGREASQRWHNWRL
jgi:hypothetical protein